MTVLLLAGYEICYNPRLVKAAEYFSENGAEIIVLNPVTGIASEKTYREFISKHAWKIIEIDISKRSIASYLRWLFVSLLNTFFLFIYKKFGFSISFRSLLTKSFLTLKFSKIPPHDLIITNLVTNLPMASEISRKFNSLLIYDSQEFFIGQYRQFKPYELKWVTRAENKYIRQADLITTTTAVMADKLKETYPGLKPVFVVRNAPLKTSVNSLTPFSSPGHALSLIWHGLSINYNTRGIHILLDALRLCPQEIHLTLQGNITPGELQLINSKAQEFGISNRLSIREPAPPDAIVQSILNYDLGVIAELPLEENQMLTSSNKLFEYIHAGLAVVASDLPGLAETIDEYKVGMLYPAGNAIELSMKLKELLDNKNLLNSFKEHSRKAASSISWENDYDPVYNFVK